MTDAWAEEKVKAERERCAAIADGYAHYTRRAEQIAAAIRKAPSHPEAKAGEVRP